MELETELSRAAELFGELTLETFRLNGQLLTQGDRMSGRVGLTSARWQVLGTLMLANEPLTVAETARRMGLARQSVQRIADWLLGQRLIRFEANPAHPRWQRARPTPKGEQLYHELETERLQWAAQVTAGVDPKRLAVALDVIRELRTHVSEHTITDGGSSC